MATRPSPGLPRLSKRSKILLAIGVAILVILVGGSRLLSSYVSWLWYDAIGFGSVYTTRLATQVVLFFAVAAFIAALVWLSLMVAYRSRPVFVPVAGSEDPLAKYRAAVGKRLKWFGIGIPVAIGLIAGATAVGDWSLVQLFLHGGSFGRTDPIFGLDIGFYTFTLPFILWLKNWFFIGVTLSFFGALFAHYLFGGIRFAGRGGQLSHPARAHLAIILGVFVLLKAFAYYMDRYSLLEGGRSDKFTGASYTDLHALMPAKLILLCIAVFCAAAFFVGAVVRNLKLPAIAIVLMLLSAIIMGSVWPLIMEQFSVRANAIQKEAQPIKHNISATRNAYGITKNKIKKVPYNPGKANPSTDSVLHGNDTVDNVRILDPNILSATFGQLGAGNKTFYGFPKQLNIDRYTVDGKTQDFIVAARQINPSGLKGSQRNWINKHLVYTHGDGFVAAPADKVASGHKGRYPIISVSDIDDPDAGPAPVKQPRIYYGTLNDNYAIVGSQPGQAPREYDTSTTKSTYHGDGGVALSNWFKRLVFAASFGERNILFSSAIGDYSKILFKRDPRDRVQAVAPWLTTDSEAYPAVIDGRVKWIVDCYTTLNNYPYSQKIPFGQATNDSRNGTREQPDRQINYIRNSVKAVVDAYDGSVKLYATKPSDPVLKAWESVFPNAVQPPSAIPKDLKQHFRYPQDLFKVQRKLLTKYHISDPQSFYSSQGFWSVPSDPTKAADGTSSGPAPAASNAAPLPPYYVLAKAPGESKPTFQLTSALNALGRQNLQSWISVSSDPRTYGQFTVLTLPPDTHTPGPGQVQNQFDSDPKVTEKRTLFNNPGVKPRFGNLMTLPVEGKLMYVEPIYIQRNDPNSFPQLAKVLVYYNGQVGFKDTFNEALADALGSSSDQQTQQPKKPGKPSQPTQTNPPPSNNDNPELDKAVSDIQKALDELKSARKSGNFADLGKAYQDLADATKRFEQAKSGSGQSQPSKPGG